MPTAPAWPELPANQQMANLFCMFPRAWTLLELFHWRSIVWGFQRIAGQADWLVAVWWFCDCGAPSGWAAIGAERLPYASALASGAFWLLAWRRPLDRKAKARLLSGVLLILLLGALMILATWLGARWMRRYLRSLDAVPPERPSPAPRDDWAHKPLVGLDDAPETDEPPSAP